MQKYSIKLHKQQEGVKVNEKLINHLQPTDPNCFEHLD